MEQMTVCGGGSKEIGRISCLTLIDGEWEKTTTLLDGGRCLNNDRYKHDSNFYATGTPTAVGLHHQE